MKRNSVCNPRSISFFIITIIYIISEVALQISKAKKISFLDKYIYTEIDEDKDIFLENYNNFLNDITVDNRIKLKFESKDKIVSNVDFVREDFIKSGELKLFTISNDFVIDENKIKNNDYYESMFKYLKDEENIFALYLLYEINLRDESIFFNYLKSLAHIASKSPILYDYSTLNLFKDDESFQKLNSEIQFYKQTYNDMRRLVFSYGEDIKNEFVGSFLFGDFLFALNVVKYHSIKIDSKMYLIPGTETLTLKGLGKADSAIPNCCLSYKMQVKEQETDLIVYLNKKDMSKFEKMNKDLSKYQSNYNPNINNEDLFLNYGISYNSQNSFDYYNLNVEEFAKILIPETRNIRNDNFLRLSLNLYDIKNFVSFWKNNNIVDLSNLFNGLVKFLESKIFIIDALFEQTYQKDKIIEVVECFKFLQYKKAYLNDLIDFIRIYAKELTIHEIKDEF